MNVPFPIHGFYNVMISRCWIKDTPVKEDKLFSNTRFTHVDKMKQR